MAESVVMTIGEIEVMARTALVRAGTETIAAQSLARAIAAAEGDGLASHGLAYLPTYCEHVRIGKVAGGASPRAEMPAPGVVVVDAGTGFAHPAIDLGFERLVPAARSQGIATLAIRNSYNCGVLGYHTERLATAGLVALGFTNAPASIAPVGGRRALFGTNPWSIAVPDGAKGAAIVIDQSASVVAKSEVIKRARKGEPIPLGWALDADGQPTADPERALKGTMAPAGGYKGVGVAILVELMAACLPGATLGTHASPFSGPAGGPPRTGQSFIAIDPGATSGGAFGERVAAILAAYAAEPGAHLPGSGRRQARERTAAAGVLVDGEIYARAAALAG